MILAEAFKSEPDWIRIELQEIILTHMECRHTAHGGLQEARHVVKPLGGVHCLEPRGLVWRGVAQGSQRLETLPDAVDVGEVHELYLSVGVVLGTLHPSAPGPVPHSGCVAPGVHYQHLPQLPPGRCLGGEVLEGGDLSVVAVVVTGAGDV